MPLDGTWSALLDGPRDTGAIYAIRPLASHVMTQSTTLLTPAGVLVALLAVVLLPGSLWGQPGPAPSGTAVGHYYSDTGEIIVSVANVSNWYVQSESLSLTGPAHGIDVLPLAPGSELVLDNPLRIGEFVFGGDFTYTDVDFGPVAETALPVDDLHVFWNPAGLSQPLLSQPIVYFDHRPDAATDPPAPQLVSGRDLLLWQRGETTPPLDTEMLATWQANFGGLNEPGAATSIPEPTATFLLANAMLAISVRSSPAAQRRRRALPLEVMQL